MKNISTYQKRILLLVGIFILLFLALNVQLPYYLYKPGSVDNTLAMIEIEDATVNEGEYNLVTVSGRQASLVDIISAQFIPFNHIEKLKDIHPDNMTDEEYWDYQLQMMKNSQDASTFVAYEAAGEAVEIINNGVFVGQIIEGMPADDLLEVGDIITKVNQKETKTIDELMAAIDALSEGDTVDINYERDGKEKRTNIQLSAFPDQPEKVGLGIVLMANDDIDVKRSIDFESGDIGGPSAGLMFALEIYDQLLDEDVSKGYQIAGTGEIDPSGEVHRIGGIDKKVVAADRAGMDIFFAPAENGRENSNYRIAKETAENIKTEMKIVPVNEFADAIDYLNSL